MLYCNLSEYLRGRYGKRLGKICIDGGFSCPNRDGKCGTGGCIYCGERGAGEHIAPAASITEQVKKRLLTAKDGELFVAYFQNFTNTYAPLDELKRRYDAALIDDRIRVLAIGTRPDCIDEGICHLLKSYAERVDVWVELGLQTVSDKTAEIINRGYSLEVFEGAYNLLKKYEIPTVVHIIVGLPGENIEDFKRTADYVGKLRPFGLKMHSIYVMRGTRLAEMYEQKLYTPPTLDEFLDAAAYTIAKMPREVVIHRMTGDCPKGMLLAPMWNADKNALIAGITERLRALGLSQGALS